MKRILTSLLLVFISIQAFSQKFTFSGKVLEKGVGNPVEFATVVLPDRELWAVADADGAFTIANVPAGKTRVEVSCLGYVTRSFEMDITKDLSALKIHLEPDNLTLQEVVVTAKDDSNSATTTRTIDKAALEQVQVMNVSDISSLLPGGATAIKSDLTGEQNFLIRAGGATEAGNAAFGTAVEVDGVRLSNNASFALTSGGQAKAVATNNIASSNIESVEVMTGVPSVEYGDMTNGVVKVNTKKGKTPWTITMSTTPNTKQLSASKGFGLNRDGGTSAGVLNASLERTQSVSDQMSPYKSYERNQLSLVYSNLFNKGVLSGTPLRFSLGVTGNLGGMDDSADPDALKNTYTKQRDNTLRANYSINWLLGKSWITNIESTGSVSFSDRLTKANEYYSSAASTVSLHAAPDEPEYYVAQFYDASKPADAVIIPRGYWYNEMCLDDRPVTFKLTLKANQASNLGSINNKIKVGGDFSGDYNRGVGEYSTDISNAPSFREYRYCDKPWMFNAAAYIEDNMMIPAGKGRINVVAGLRNDNTIINGSAYGVTSSLSPRFNLKYTVLPEKGRSDKALRSLVIRASWGMAVKQPSYSVLYPQPEYKDYRSFASTTASDGTSYMSYIVIPKSIEYNPALRWQANNQSELGLDFNLYGNKISLSGFYNLTNNSFRMANDYSPLSYNYTLTSALSGCTIPADDRVFTIDREGNVTVSDRTGKLAPQALASGVRSEFIKGAMPDNMTNPIKRYGLEWTVDFKKLKALNTSIRMDGTWYGYKTLDTDIKPYYAANYISADGSPYKYVGYFYGGDGAANGSRTATLRNNLTVTTHIPKVRMVLSLKLESTLLRFSQSLSDRLDGTARSYVNTNRNDFLAVSDESIYAGENYTILYPDYYISVSNPSEKIDFLSTLKAAKGTDQVLYGDLTKLIRQTNYTYQHLKDFISPYFSANISVTKELGDLASISFYANNFINNIQLVHSSKTGNYSSVTSYIPKFYYGLTVRFKF